MTPRNGTPPANDVEDEPKINGQDHELEHIDVLPRGAVGAEGLAAVIDGGHIETRGDQVLTPKAPHETEGRAPAAEALVGGVGASFGRWRAMDKEANGAAPDWVVGVGVERAAQQAKVESRFKRKADLGCAPPPTMGRACARSLHGVREAVLEAEGEVDTQ